MKRTLTVVVALVGLAASTARAEIRRDPNGVNVNANGATSVFITFGGLDDQVPAEAFWCGDLISAAPDSGFKCDPGTIFGRLPLRYDQSRLSGAGGFTDIMSIPPSVTRRAYQAAERGASSAFFYVRRFESLSGGPDEYVFVTCRMAGGGARVPLALLDVQLQYENGQNVLWVPRGEKPSPISAQITYNGTGRLKGRWEIVIPGEDAPSARDLLPEAALPAEERPLQRRFAQVQRFNVFLPPTGRYTLSGPDISRLPTNLEGLYLILLRVEASDDKEGDSNLGNAGAGEGVVHSGAVAGFPMPVLRYVVGGSDAALPVGSRLLQVLPAAEATLGDARGLQFSWTETATAALYRLEIQDASGELVLSAMVQPGVGVYRAPSWLPEKTADGLLRWRVVAIGPNGETAEETGWRAVRVASVR